MDLAWVEGNAGEGDDEDFGEEGGDSDGASEVLALDKSSEECCDGRAGTWLEKGAGGVAW